MLDRLRNRNTKEPEVNLKIESERWKNSLIVEKPWENIYLAAISPKIDAEQILYCRLVTDETRAARIDIPVIDNFTIHELRMQSYIAASILGSIDKESFRRFATEEFNAKKYITFLNQNVMGIKNDWELLGNEISSWMSDMFGLDHYRRFGEVYVGSYGGDKRHVITIAKNYPGNEIIGNTQLVAEKFARVVERSLPQLNLYPLSVKDYLETIRSKLKFMPQDWK